MTTGTAIPNGAIRRPNVRDVVASPLRGLELFGVALAGLALVGSVIAATTYAEVHWLSYARGSGLKSAVALLTGLLILVALGLPRALVGVRRLSNLTRRLSGEWCGVVIAPPYPPNAPDDGKPGSWPWSIRAFGQSATWRDLAWALVAPCASPFLLLPLVATGCLAWYSLVPGPGRHDATAGTAVLGVLTVAAIGSGPWLLLGYGLLARLLLGPTSQVELTRRVHHLTATRSDSLDLSAAEFRRIERDLHDGAQARLVALGMTLGALEEVLDKDSLKARALLLEARTTSSKALAELRNLVRGVHPPVLADRGLVDAVRALALDNPLPVDMTSDLDGRPPAPVESAVYFGVSELLANVSKHSGATKASVKLRHSDGALVASVGDNGHGGANPSFGTGLKGIERRVVAFDGRLTVDSPQGGPTLMVLEVPCELSSPRTSSF